MKYVTILIAVFALTACQSNETPENNNTTDTEVTPEANSSDHDHATHSETEQKVTPGVQNPEHVAQREEFKKTVKRIQQETNNPSSVYKYLITSEEFKVFGQMLKLSDWAKYTHNNKVTVFAPVDSIFKSYSNQHLMLKPENKDKLNEFISNYITDEQLTFKSFKVAEVINTKGDRSYKVSTENGITLQGAEVKTGYIQVDNGTIIELKGLPFYPSGLK